MSLRDLMGADESADERTEQPRGIPDPDADEQPEQPEASGDPDADEDIEDGEFYVTSADIDARLIVRSVQVDTAEEQFRATSAQGFDTLIAALREEARPYRVINRFTGKVYDSFLDFVPPAQAE